MKYPVGITCRSLSNSGTMPPLGPNLPRMIWTGVFRFQLHHRHRTSNAVHMRDKHRQLCDLMIEQAIEASSRVTASRHVEPARSSRNFGFVLILQCLAQCGFKPISFVRSQDDRIRPRERREFNGRIFLRVLSLLHGDTEAFPCTLLAPVRWLAAHPHRSFLAVCTRRRYNAGGTRRRQISCGVPNRSGSELRR